MQNNQIDYTQAIIDALPEVSKDIVEVIYKILFFALSGIE